MTRRQFNQNFLNRRGAAVVELAISLPVLLVVMFGTLEICNSMTLRKNLTVAAYEGGMVSVLPNATSTDVVLAINQVLADRGVQNASISISPQNIETAVVGTNLRIEITANYSDNCLVLGGLFNSIPLKGAACFVKEY